MTNTIAPAEAPQQNPADIEPSMHEAVQLAQSKESYGSPVFGGNEKSFDGITVTTKRSGSGAGGVVETKVSDSNTGTELKEEDSNTVGGRDIVYQAKIEETGQHVDTTYHAQMNPASIDKRYAEQGRGWGPVVAGAPEQSGVDIVRTDKQGNEVYRHTAKSSELAHAVGKRAAAKLVDRMQ